MKNILLVATILLTGCATHSKYVKPVDLSQAISHVEKASQSLSEAEKSKSQEVVQTRIRQAKGELSAVKEDLISEQARASELSEDRDFWKSKSQTQEKEISTLKVKLSHFHHLLFIASFLVGIMVAFVVGKFSMAFSPYGALIGIGAGVAASGSTWAILEHL